MAASVHARYADNRTNRKTAILRPPRSITPSKCPLFEGSLFAASSVRHAGGCRGQWETVGRVLPAW